ncbi:MAG TPA: flagellar hook capping FlgD N-terminal domain-containing protein, partial [Candidatus Acidoferrum sp.]|nr:flagellar hook capping FlgD N-terminal domain-containing protein [Candidatus Acidoferrum sp.]
MNIQDLFPSSSSSSTTTAAAPNPNKALGADDFMKLLVTQMNNQDPSNPQDNTAFLAQLAQFTMVNGVNKLGTSMDSMTATMTNSQAMQAANLVGHDVLSSSNIALLESGKPVIGQVTVPSGTTGLNIQVRDAAGSLVKTIPSTDFTPGDQAFYWDGTDENGNTQSPGDYSVSVTALVNGQQQALTPQMFNPVLGVSLAADHSTVQLQLPGA